MKLKRVHFKMLQVPGFVCSVHLISRICVLNALKNVASSRIAVLCALKIPAITRIFVLCALKDPAIARSFVLCALRSAAISRIFVLNALRSAAISEILKWTFRPTSGHGNLLWPLLLGLGARPIPKRFCSWGPSGSGTEHKHRLT